MPFTSDGGLSDILYSTSEADLILQKDSGYRYVIAGLVGMVVFATVLTSFAIGPIAPLIVTEYGVSNATVGLLTSIPLLSHAIFAIPISLLIRRFGVKTMILLGGATGAAPLLTFVLPDGFLPLLALRTVQGLSIAFLISAHGPLFMQWFPSRQLPLANGSFMVFAGLGIAVSSFLIAPLAEIFYWDIALSMFGGLALCSTIAWWIFGKAQSIYPDRRDTQAIAIDESPGSLIRQVWDVARHRVTILVAMADVGPFAFLVACLAWLPTLYHEVHEISLTAAGVYTGVLQSVGIIALIVASVLTARTHRRRPFLIGPGVLIGFSGLLALVVPESFILYVVVGTLGFVLWFYAPALMTLPMDIYPNDPHRVALIFATLLTISSFASAIMPWAIGMMADITGSLVPGLAASAVLAWSIVIAGILLPSPRE